MVSSAFERLESAFAELDRHEILARHYPEDGRSDAYSLVEAEIATARHEGKSYLGYCFYDQFGLERSNEGALFLCFGGADAPPTYAELWRKQVEVGAEVVRALRAKGLDTQWSGGPNDVIWVSGQKWKLPRDRSGALLIATGPRRKLGEHRAKKPQAPAGKNVFIHCPPGSPDGHRLVQAIHRVSGGDVYCVIDRFEEQAAATAVRTDGVLLDFVAAASPRHAALALLSARDFVNESEFFVEIGARKSEPQSAVGNPFWSQFSPDKRLFVSVEGGAGMEHKDGSRVHDLDLRSGEGIAELVGFVKTALQS